MDTGAQISHLSVRQKEILRLIAQHMQAKEVAIALKISEHTVRTHTVSARRKLGVASSRDAARLLLAYERGAVPLVDDELHPSSTIVEPAAIMPHLEHEQEPSPYQKIPAQRGLYDPQLGGSGSRAAADSRSHPLYENSGDNWRTSGAEPGRWAGENHPDLGGSHSFFDERWRQFKRKLKRLSALQWLGMTLLLSASMGIVVVVFLAISLTSLETFQHIVRRFS